MPKDIILDIATGFLVLGSVFGASHLKKLATWTNRLFHPGKSLTKPTSSRNRPAGAPTVLADAAGATAR